MFTSNNAHTIIIAFDRDVFPSIKYNDLRGAAQGACYRILGAEMRRPEFAKELKNINFKKALVEFLLMDWTKNELEINFIGNKKFYINYFMYKV